MKGPDGRELGIPYSKAKMLGTPQGYNFADSQEAQRFMKYYAHDPEVIQSMAKLAQDNPGLSMFIGMGRHALQYLFGASEALTGNEKEREGQWIFGVPPAASKTGKGPSTLEQFAKSPDENFAERLGGLGMEAGAFARGEPEARALIGGERMLSHPIVSHAVTQGATAGAQTYMKTGDAGAALRAAAETSAVSLVIGSSGKGISNAIANRATTLEDVGGVQTPVPAAARNVKPTPEQAAGQQALTKSAQSAARSHLAEVNESRAVPESAPALPARTGPFEFKLKGLNPVEGTIGNIAHPAAKFEPTASRVPEGGTPGAQNVGQMGSMAQTIPNRLQQRTQAFTTSSTGETVPAAERLSEAGGGEMTTQDPIVARAHIETLNQAIEGPGFARLPDTQKQQLLEARADAQEQMARYHQEVLQTLPGYGKPNFAPVDIPRVVSTIGSWSETGQAVTKTATDGYKQIMDALAFTGESPQHLTMIRQAYQAAEAKFMEADNPAALSAAEQSIEKTHEELRNLLARVPNAANLKEFSGMNDAYRNGLGLQKIGNAIDRAFHAPMSSAKRSFEYSGYDGKQLLTNVEGLIRTMGRGRVVRLMGKDNLDTVLQVGQLSSTIAGRARLGAAVNAVRDSLLSFHVGPIAAGGFLGHFVGVPWEVGAGAGWATSVASKRLMSFILTNPKVAQNLIFAIESGAKPENYGPFIATMIQKSVSDSTLKQQEKQREQEQQR